MISAWVVAGNTTGNPGNELVEGTGRCGAQQLLSPVFSSQC